MKCMECGKALTRYAAQITTPAGEVVGWGPKCARKALRSARRRAGRVPSGRRSVNPRQMALFLEAAP